MERLILARHAETEWNVERLLNGDPSVDVRLSERGREEARRLGGELDGAPVDLCVVSAFPRTRATAELALAGRDVPVEVVPELGDPDYGDYEGGSLDAYRDWAAAHDSTARPGGGEARRDVARRYAHGFRTLLERPERALLAVLHSLPVAYALAAREGVPPEPRARLVENARPYPFTRAELERAVSVLEAWCASPTW